MERLGEILRRWLAETPEAQGATDLFQGWQDIVGAELAAHTRPVEVEKGKLIVEVDHPGWVQLLNTGEPAIIKRLNRSHGSLSIERIITVLSNRIDSE